MKTLIALLLAALTALSSSALLAETSSTINAPSNTERSATQVPDFPPPEDINGLAFPPEVLITKPDEATNKFLSDFLSTMATLGLIISLILIVAWFLKRMVNTRMEQANNTSSIRIIEQRMLSQKTVIYMLEIEGKGIIVAESPHGVTLLGDYPIAAEDTAQSTQPKTPSSFAKMLEKER